MVIVQGKSIKIQKISGEAFSFQKMQIEDYLYQKGMLLHILGEKFIDIMEKEWALLHKLMFEVFQLVLSRNVAFNIVNEKTMRGLMVALSNMYKKPSASNKAHLMRRLFNLRMIKGVFASYHINKFSTITTQLSSVEIEFDDEVQVLILLSFLSKRWNAMVTTLGNSSRRKKMAFKDV